MQNIEIGDGIGVELVRDLNPKIYSSTNDILIISESDLTYVQFLQNIMLQNVPCLIKNASYLWESAQKWTKDGKINFSYLIDSYGDLDAPVADCNSINYNSQNKSIMKVCDYINYLEDKKREKLLYLKDWHLRRLRPSDTFYIVPRFFTSDWLNEYATDQGEDDFMFVYIGPESSWTPFHADVYSSYSWSVNITGQKKWILLPPGEENKIKDKFGNFPLLYDCKNRNVKHIEIIQNTGDALFVPSGWHHQVTNLLDTISINHNWVNGCNIEQVWISLQNHLASVEKEIIDLKDTPEFTSQCQLILKSIFGMDINMFITFVTYIGKKRLNQLKEHTPDLCNEWGMNHVMFDLNKVNHLMNLIDNSHLALDTILIANVNEDYLYTKNNIFSILNIT